MSRRVLFRSAPLKYFDAAQALELGVSAILLQATECTGTPHFQGIINNHVILRVIQIGEGGGGRKYSNAGIANG